ncbi:MAG: hypothetical protein WCK89_04595 [bacterium]
MLVGFLVDNFKFFTTQNAKSTKNESAEKECPMRPGQSPALQNLKKPFFTALEGRPPRRPPTFLADSKINFFPSGRASGFSFSVFFVFCGKSYPLRLFPLGGRACLIH